MVKVITVKPGESLSLQYHHRRDEFWHVLSGDGTAEIDGQSLKLEPGGTCFIPRGTKHRVHGGASVLVFLELAFGDFDENDIIRLEDKYGRK
jgi:mannose-6-phosphate isomerase